jgi:protein phosphatase
MKIVLPELALIVLMGPAGAGKSTLAKAHFKPTEVVSSDLCRALVADEESDQTATAAAFELLHLIVSLRLSRRRLTVVDAVNARPGDRRPLLELARQHDCAAVAIVLDVPEQVCVERDAGRAGRKVGPRPIHLQSRRLTLSLGELPDEGFAQVHVLDGDAASEVSFKRVPLAVNRRWDRGPFDVIGDVHGCSVELDRLLISLGYRRPPEGTPAPEAFHPEGRKAVFVGDLVGHGGDTAGVLRRVMGMVAAGSALCVLGDHDRELLRELKDRAAKPAEVLQSSPSKFHGDDDLQTRTVELLEGLPSHYVLDRGGLVVAHAGIKTPMQGRDSPRITRFAVFGEMLDAMGEAAVPVPPEWARAYRGRSRVVYGHRPVSEPAWVGRTIDIDTGCVFGGRLTALRYPELELVSVAAAGRTAQQPAPQSAAILNIDIQPGTFSGPGSKSNVKEVNMPQTVREVMTAKPLALQEGTTLVEAARAMRNHDVGDVVLLDDDQVTGIVTDRDMTIRAVAEGMDPNTTVLAQIASKELATVSPDATVDEAVDIMRSRAVRRLPVVEDGRVIGILSLGDLAVERAPDSPLADISAADPNR